MPFADYAFVMHPRHRRDYDHVMKMPGVTLLAVLAVVLGSCGGTAQTAASPSAAAPSVVPTATSTLTPATPVATASSQSSAKPIGFVLPATCAYAGSAVVGTDQTQWKFDCGSTANRDARGTLAPAFTQQGWTSCGAVTATATWINGPVRLIVSEGSGAPGEIGLPMLSQTARSGGAACP